MKPMKTLADFRRALVVGSVWEGENANYGPLGCRRVARVRSKGVGFETEGGAISWLDYPKASELRFGDDGWIYIRPSHFDEAPYNFPADAWLLRYRLVS